jgi:transposase
MVTRYASGGGLTAKMRVRRESVRLEAAQRFARSEKNADIAAGLRIHVRTIEKWRQRWRTGGAEALRWQEPASLPRPDEAQFVRLERELERGPLSHGFVDQRWTLARIKTLIGRLFHVSHTIQGVRKLLVRNGWSCQVPVHRALERDDAVVETWMKETWPLMEAPQRPSAPTSSSRTRPERRLGRPKRALEGGAACPPWSGCPAGAEEAR